MSKVRAVRALVEQRLTAAAEEIFGLFERTIAEYEEELCRSKEENERQQKLLDAVFNPQLHLHRADVRQLLEVKEEVPSEQQVWSCSLDQEEPEPPHIKEEQEELWSSQEGEQQLQGLQEADITKFTLTPVPVKSEDDEEKPQSSQLHQTKTEPMEEEADGEDCGGPEPHRNADPHLQRDPDFKASDSSETEVSDDDWKESREPQSGLTSLNNNDVSVSDLKCSAGEKPFSCSECGKRFGCRGSLKRHMRSHTGEKPFSCSVCEKSFAESGSLHKHMQIHTGEKPFSCSVCHKRFLRKTHLKVHMITHTGERPFHCSVCGKTFKQKIQLTQHMALHTGEKPFSCSLCGKGFIRKSIFQLHIKSHIGEKPFSCSECGKSFILMTHLTQHMRIHTGEKLFSCTVCAERFTLYSSLKTHLCVGGQLEENREAESQTSSSVKQIKREADGEDCGGPESVRNSDPDKHPTSDFEDFSDPETDDSNDWKETGEPQSGLNSFSDLRCSTSEKLFRCSECGKIFYHNGNLKRHMRSHTGEKPFSCSFCKKSFTQSGHLQRHLRIHTGEKPFSCSECGKIFGTSGSLKRHVIIHTGEKPFSCSFCHKSFTRNVSLQLHLRFHTGKKLFSCLVCGKSFSQAGNLSQHMIHIHTRKKPLSCSV